MSDVQQELRDLVAAGPPGYRPATDPYRRVAARVRSRRRRRAGAVLAVAAGVAAVAGADVVSRPQLTVVTAPPPSAIDGHFVLAPVVGITPRPAGASCAPGTLSEVPEGADCYRLDADEVGFTARARVVFEPGQHGHAQWVVRLDLPPEAVRKLRAWTDPGNQQPVKALVVNGAVVKTVLLALPFEGTTLDVGVQSGQRADAEALLRLMAT